MRGSSVVLLGKNPTSGEYQPLLVSNTTGALETEAIVSSSLGDIVQLPDDLYNVYDDPAGTASPRTETVKADLNGIAGVTTSVVRSGWVLLKDSVAAAGAEVGSIKYKTTTMTVFGPAIPLFNERSETFPDLEITEIELTITTPANTRSIVYVSGRKLT